MSRNLTGLLLTLFSPASWRSYLAAREGRSFDARYGTDTRAMMPLTAFQDVSPELLRHAVQYEASAIPKLRRGLRAVRRRLGDSGLHDHTFVDFGSGKGLVVMLASQLPFKEVWGVEMAPALHGIAQSNLRKFQERGSVRAPVRLVRGDALDLEWPSTNVVAYLYNPFDAILMRRFVERLTRYVRESGRSVIVIYVNPLHRAVLDDAREIRPLSEHHTVCTYECVGTSR